MRRGKVVLTPFPFTDLSGAKVRPAVVISRSDRLGQDVILAFITANQTGSNAPDHVVIAPGHPSFSQTGLKVTSVLRLDKVVTLDSRLVLGELGQLPDDLTDRMGACLRFALSL